MREIVLGGVSEASSVYLGFDVNSWMQREGIKDPNAQAFTLHSNNGVALMGRHVPGQSPIHLTAPHIRFDHEGSKL